MSERLNIVTGFYDRIEEDKRLEKSRHGQLEFCTTMEYIHRYAKKGDRILEIGAGTGRYSIALAKEGFDVTAVELVESNLDVLKKNSEGVAGIEENFDSDYKVRHFEEQLFTGYDIVEFEQLFETKPVCYLSTVAVDSVMELVRNNTDFAEFTDEGFEAFAKYHLATCEKRELLGCSSHLLYICRRGY